jgi:hypothetical protein
MIIDPTTPLLTEAEKSLIINALLAVSPQEAECPTVLLVAKLALSWEMSLFDVQAVVRLRRLAALEFIGE